MRVLFFVVTLIARLAAQPAFSDIELSQPPTPARLASVRAVAQRDGWAPQVAPLRAMAVRAYELEKFSSAEAWLHLYRWAALWGMKEGEFVSRWVAAVNAAKVGHPNMPSNYQGGSQSLGQAVSPDLQAWLLGNAAFSAEFFATLSAVDYLPEVFRILDELYRRDAVRFKKYPSLALAIAVDYDLPPPPDWPHAQVSPAALPRKLPAPADAFAWWTHQDEIGHTYHRLTRLTADELRFVVDTAAPLAELEWAQKISDYPLSQLARAYSMVRYRIDRLVGRQSPNWPGTSYKLNEILAAGGICVDQAYFATEVGKARGVPTLFFRGAGKDGRHAWFGFLDGNSKWQLDAGRYAEQRFVTGFARDPQTWAELTDHEIQFLSERFHALPSFQQSRLHAQFAAHFLDAGDTDAAARAARKAVNYERRNQDGWDILIAAAQKSGRDARTSENIMREAIIAFQRYPDLEAGYVNRLAASLRARGQTSEADNEVRRIAIKNKGERSDLSVAQASEILRQSVATEPVEKQIRAYNGVLEAYGRDAGIAFFDQIVVAFVEHLVELHQTAEAVRALDRARQTMKVAPSSQLEGEFARVAKMLRSPK